ncbi:endonuclease/exonuclease/phosphatase family protein [Kitasatospora sp. NBC_01560]|uniref:endonuclease/exonuclease/phosphatase family protein n=1 Tax=Kitasatospora sp. NBC_01560 TaxID=2975965 RepID=UPI003865FD9C
MNESLRILSFNTQLRSWGMEAGFPPTLPPVDTAAARAGFIADNILSSAFDYDIVGLCEVFDEDARAILRDSLRARFPYIVTKCDGDYLQAEEAGAGQTCALSTQWVLIGVPDVVTGWRPEDSGLMVLSRWPFAQLDTGGLDSALKQQSADRGYPVPAVVPAVNFLPYQDAAGLDRFAAKGIAYARIVRAPGQEYHLFLSHTQADASASGQYRGTRSRQMAAAEEFIGACTGGAPSGEEIFFLGDLNIVGELMAEADHDGEWKSCFDAPGRLLSDRTVDLWGRRQCTGPPGLRDRGYSATVTYDPRQQRLDYASAATTGSLAAQHVMIDYDLANVPPGHPEVSYLSDHRPLRVELASPRPHSTPATALAAAAGPADFDSGRQLLADGQTMWLRFDEAGTYDFRLDQDHDRIAYEVYLDTDLSRPRRQYRQESTPRRGDKYVIAAPPFLVKVFPRARTGEARFEFHAHRHQGVGPEDAIQLPYGEIVPESFPVLQLLNQDFPATDWVDEDTKWFRLDGPPVSLGSALKARITVTRTRGDPGFTATVVREDPPGTWRQLTQSGGGATAELDALIDKGDQLYVQVTRWDQPSLRELGFLVAATVDLTLVLGGSRGAPRLVCTKETGGWGADDIELGITTDGVPTAYVDNDTIGDFEQDAVRDLNQWVPEFLPYRKGVEFMVKELDDIGHDDIGRETLRPFAELDGWSRFAITDRTSPGRMHGFLRVDVDDGRYDVELTVTTWDEQF